MFTPVRGVNNAVEYVAADGEGTEANPYRLIRDVNVLDGVEEDISRFLGQALALDCTFAGDILLNQTVIPLLAPTVAPVAGNFLCIQEGVRHSQAEILSVADQGASVYNVTVSMPIDYAYSPAAKICLQNCNMNVNGSVTPVEFSISPASLDATEKWHLSRMIVAMSHSSAGDDGLFGGITKLAKGVYARLEGDNKTKNLFNIRENADLRTEGYDVVYPTRSGGGGTYGTAARITFNGQEKRGVVLALRADAHDRLVFVVRDNLTGLSSFRIKLQGHAAAQGE